LRWISFSAETRATSPFGQPKDKNDTNSSSRLVAPRPFAAILSAGAASALTQDADGRWTRDDGAARIQFSPCGAPLCGVIV
jgi:uncharacterized protein (DUF2147 family)